MSMLDIKHFTKTPVERLRKLNIGDKIVLLTYKKDRKIIITKNDDNTYDVLEDGFEIKEFLAVEHSKLEKLLKQLQYVEFPRSNKYFMEIIPVPKKQNK